MTKLSNVKLAARLINHIQYKTFATKNIQVKSVREIDQEFFRTNESDPIKQTHDHRGLFYTIPKNISNHLFLLGGFDKEIQDTMKVFQETCIMIRQPFLDISDYINRTDFNKPPNSYIIYGPIGRGKTFTLNHILHYGYNKKMILICCHRPTDWIKYPQEKNVSESNTRRIDTPLDAAIWLQQFKSQNHYLLEELKLTLLHKYTWSQREHSNPGDSLISLIDHGINRIKHASDCMAVLLKELQYNSAKGNCQLLLIVDKINAFYEPSEILFPDRTYATVDEITIARAFKKLFKKDWKNGAIVAAVCKKLVVPYRLFPISGPQKKEIDRHRTYKKWGPFKVDHISDYPKSLLTDDGFQDLNPFIPIEVPNYDDKEINSCLDYYQDRRWIQRETAKTYEAREEIKFLSGFNPGQVFRFSMDL